MDVGSVAQIKLPATPEAASVRAYLQAYAAKDFSAASEFFTEDVVFNDAMCPTTGRDYAAKCLSMYAKEFLTTFRVEAANEAGSKDRYLAICSVALKGSDEIPSCDLITLRDGKICRVDNCFDVEKFSSYFHCGHAEGGEH